MRIQVVAAVIFVAAVGCDHKSKEKEAPPPDKGGGGSVAPKASGDLPPEPVGREPTKPTKPDGEKPATPPPADDVRAPTADDLAEYTKDLKGDGKLNATIETSLGTFHCELFADKAPMTVANFVGLATGKKAWKNPKTGAVEKGKPYFDGLVFHRVIPTFMIQGGDPLGEGFGGPGYMFGNEFVNDLKMDPGTLAMANADDPSVGRVGTNGSQFFIMEGAAPNLVGRHTIFGRCKELDLVKKITAVPRDERDKPQTPVVMQKVTIGKGKL